MKEVQFMRSICVDQLKTGFRDIKTPEQIKKLFAALGYEYLTSGIVERLSLLSAPTEGRNSHLQDAMEIAEIADALPKEYFPKYGLNELRAESLLHDIGKTGPAEATEEERRAFVELFDFEFQEELYDGVSRRDLTLAKALEIKVREGAFSNERAKEVLRLILAAVEKQENKRPETRITAETKMRDVWGAHTYWTYDILKKLNFQERMVIVTSSHHLLEKRNPAGIDINEVGAEIAFLELADKYQAARVRNLPGGDNVYINGRKPKTHAEAILFLRERITEVFADHPKTAAVYLAILEIIDQDRKMFEIELDLPREQGLPADKEI